ncbi:ribosome small subunit-dependent GTPase A [Jannaschia pohangensis]|nr:ribosome small subunit-dependent GTPase A [Jannaschia pohangensis]
MDAPALPMLTRLGWQSFFAQQIDADALTRTPPARVTRVNRTTVHLLGDGIDMVLPLVSDLAVGDWVLLEEDRAAVAEVLDRKSLIKRRAAGHDRQVQLIAANIDTAFVVTSCNQDFNVARLERYLALAFEAEVDPVILLTKPDLSEDVATFVAEAAAISDMVPVLAVNAKSAEVAAQLAGWCKPGRTIAFLGSSGVGKSTLVNALSGTLTAETQGVRTGDDKGRHTTTRRELHLVSGGFAVLDTPGMRELQMTDAADGIADVFSDLADLAGGCRFSDCSHTVEPGCALKAGIAAGDLDPARLERWQKLVAEDAHNSATLAERKSRDKALGKTIKGIQKKSRK